MENTTPFNLDRSLARWREELSANDVFRSQDIAELETHLTESISSWISKGLTAEESFFVAQKRMGTSASLAAEYNKTNGNNAWQKRLFWMIAGAVLLGLASGLSAFASNAVMLAGLQFSNNASAVGWVGATVSTAAFVLSLWLVLQYAKNPSHSALTRHFTMRPVMFTALAIAGYLLSRIVPALSSMILMRTANPTEVGQLFFASTNFGAAFQLAFGCFLIVAMANLYRRQLAQ
jgi:hypothetical protein